VRARNARSCGKILTSDIALGAAIEFRFRHSLGREHSGRKDTKSAGKHGNVVDYAGTIWSAALFLGDGWDWRGDIDLRF